MDYKTIPPQETIDKTIAALKSHHIDAQFVQTGAEAKELVLSMVPKGAEVMTMTSITLDTIGVAKILNESSDYNSIREKFMEWGDDKAYEKRKLGAAPEWAFGSVHAVTEDGRIMVASGTGSQLPAYAYGSLHVIWVVGAQKIVKDFEAGMKRIYDYVLPLESIRANKAYNITTGSAVNKMLIINNESNANRHLTMIIVGEALGF